jgi:hypothetical protein
MNMTHYMELLAVNQPWNLLIYMAVPVILAETVAISELYLLYTKDYGGGVHTLNKIASIAGGGIFVVIFIYLLATAVVPITKAGGWRGPADVIAVASYLACVVPLGAIALIDLGVVAKGLDAHRRMGIHAAFVALFLVIAHIAMIFGMMDPTVLGAAPTAMKGHGH